MTTLLLQLLLSAPFLVLDALVSLSLDLAFDSTSRKRKKAVPGREEVAWAALLSLSIGFFTGCILPVRLLPPGPFPGISIIVLPVVLGGLMSFWGRYRKGLGRGLSYLATWSGGVAIGVSLAVGRLLGMGLHRILE